jgi:uncharacterized protein YdaU (DUF1376 family)
MANGAPYFQCYPADFLSGIVDLEPDEIAVYTVVLMLIYDRGGAIPDDRKSLARRCHMTPKRLSNSLDHLVEMGKLQIENGSLTNPRAAKEIEKFRKKSEKNAENISKRWNRDKEEKSEKPHKINDATIRTNSDRIEDVSLRARGPEARSQKLESRDSSTSVAPYDIARDAAAQTVKHDLRDIEARCRQAAGVESDPSPGLLIIGPIVALIDAGYSLDIHILPTLRAIRAEGKSLRTWAFAKTLIVEKCGKSPPGSIPPPAPVIQLDIDPPTEIDWHRRYNTWKERAVWGLSWGPAPLQPGSPVTPELAAKFDALGPAPPKWRPANVDKLSDPEVLWQT